MDINIEIKKQGSEYIFRKGSEEQTHHTFLDLIHSIIKAFHDNSKTEPESVRKDVLVEIMQGLINYLFQHHFSPSQVVDVLHHLEDAVQHNIGAGRNLGHTIQLRLACECPQKTIRFIEAHPFPFALTYAQQIGRFLAYNYNGSTAIKRKGGDATIFLKKTDIQKLISQGKEQNTSFLASAGVSEPKRTIIVEYIEDLKDDKLGMFPMLRAETRVGDSGEIDAEVHEEGEYINIGGGE